MSTSKNNIVVSSVIISLAFIISVLILGNYLYKIRSLDDTISVSGSTREKVISDNGKLSIKIDKTVPSQNITLGYQDIQKQASKISAFLKLKGINEKDIVVSPLSSFEEYQQNNTEKRYNLSQVISLSLSDVYLLDSIAKEIPLQSSNDSVVSVLSLEFYYSKLPELRVSLIQRAIADAKERAKNITEATDVSVGKLKSASTGIVQVVQVNSTDVSDYGTYDTSTIEKEVIVTVRASFRTK